MLPYLKGIGAFSPEKPDIQLWILNPKKSIREETMISSFLNAQQYTFFAHFQFIREFRFQ